MTKSRFELKAKSFTQLRSEFLAGDYDESWEEHNCAMTELHNKMNDDVLGLIPMLESSNRHCQYVAAYIAAEEGNGAADIFEHIFPLIHSEWPEVRDKACGCFLNCTSEPSHYLALLALLDDAVQAIRLHVVTVILGLSEKLIGGIYTLTSRTKSSLDIQIGLKILKNGYSSDVSKGLFEDRSLELTRETKVFSYAAAYRHLGDTNDFRMLAQKFDDEDIKRHYEIYFGNQ